MSAEGIASSGRRSARLVVLFRLVATVVLLAASVLVGYATYVGFVAKVKIDPNEIQKHDGLAYIAEVQRKPVWPLSFASDSVDFPNTSRAILRENGVALGPRHTQHAIIATIGDGRYSHWGRSIYFSSSDGSDPRTNGKQYRLYLRSMLLPDRAVGLLGAIVVCGVLIWLPSLKALLVPRWRKLKQEEWSRTAIRRFATFVLIAIATCLAIAFVPALMAGAWLWIGMGAVPIFVLLAIGQAIKIWDGSAGRRERSGWLANVALVVGSLALTSAGLEWYLGHQETSALTQLPQEGSTAEKTATAVNAADGVIQEGRAEIVLPAELITKMENRRALLTLPKEWELTRVTVENSRWSFYWHGILHIHDEDGFRRYIGPFPEKKPGVFRVMIVGDSMTYGDGIEADWTYGAQLQRLMQKYYHIEFITLGADGRQSTDILRNVKTMLPLVRPDLVIYGVCYNDFLPSGVGQYDKLRFPLPEWFKTMVMGRTRLGPLISDSYISALILAGFSLDFYDDILKDFDGYQQRFSADVMRMNDYVKSAGLPPIVGMPLDQNVKIDGRGHQISRIAEDWMRKAGFDVISLEGYYKKYNGENFVVSRWEGHPNEQAYAIFAAMLANHLIGQPYLEKFKLIGAAPSQ